jgi:integrase
MVDERLLKVTCDAPTARRERVLSAEELARLLPALRDRHAEGDRHASVMALLLLTGCRREEVAAARWSDVDLEKATLTVPAARSKNGRAHRVPLSRQALALLADLPRSDGLVFTRPDGRPLASWTSETLKIQVASLTTGWHRHDLRRTAATLLGQMGTAPHVIESALNHAAIHSALAATYNRSRYGAEVATALQLLADQYDAISGANVVPIRAA